MKNFSGLQKFRIHELLYSPMVSDRLTKADMKLLGAIKSIQDLRQVKQWYDKHDVFIDWLKSIPAPYHNQIYHLTIV